MVLGALCFNISKWFPFVCLRIERIEENLREILNVYILICEGERQIFKYTQDREDRKEIIL